MCNDRLSYLSLMSIEADILREINFEDLVNELARKSSKSFTTLVLKTTVTLMLSWPVVSGVTLLM